MSKNLQINQKIDETFYFDLNIKKIKLHQYLFMQLTSKDLKQPYNFVVSNPR